MNITNFDPRKVDFSNQPTSYHSEVYQQSFPFLPTPRGGNRYVIKLDSLNKPQIKANIQGFLDSLPENSSDEGFLDSEEFYNNPLHHQLYKFRLLYPTKKDLLSIYFHTKDNNSDVESYLNTLQEAFVLRSSVRGKFLDEKLREDFASEFERFLASVPKLATQDTLELTRIPCDQYRQDHIRYNASVLFTALSLAKRQKKDPIEVLKLARSIKEGSPFILDAVVKSFE